MKGSFVNWIDTFLMENSISGAEITLNNTQIAYENRYSARMYQDQNLSLQWIRFNDGNF